MPDQSSAASEHAILQEITAPLATLPHDPVEVVARPEFPIVLRGYDRLAVDAYVKRTSQLVAELHATHSPEAAVRRALERVGEQISGILQRAHDTAEELTTQSRREAEERLERARDEAAQITLDARTRLKDLDADTDRIWVERDRIVDDARELARQLVELADAATERFPPAEEPVVAAGGESAPAIEPAAPVGTAFAEPVIAPELGMEPEPEMEPEAGEEQREAGEEPEQWMEGSEHWGEPKQPEEAEFHGEPEHREDPGQAAGEQSLRPYDVEASEATQSQAHDQS